ncbi:uncharacterized protein LOC129291689 [Prosopis cineraria]|uniref:uncharacterized protein LOC129291689 n=1 Tax=Prosopis cineraria TaxID=364024 RepID=UPI00240FA1C3|nr:uncharacterized protein LOC129291689 [Prosopis cineraria]
MNSEKTEDVQKQSTLQIKQDDKFFRRLLSKESSLSNPSFRVTPVSVPFLWESHPGTPKHPLSDLSPPPLTPPPSHFCDPNHKKPSRSRSLLLRFSFPSFSFSKTLLPSSSSSSSLSSSSSSSDSSGTVVPSNGRRRRRRFLSCDSSADLWGNSNCEEEEEGGDALAADSANLGSCFGFRGSASSNAGFGSCYGRRKA